MPNFYDLCNRGSSEDLRRFAKELGWTAVNGDFETVFLEASDWGELKRKIKDSRDGADALVFLGGDEKLNRKAVSDTRIDVVLHPEKGRKDSGIDHVMAEEAAENRVAIGFDFSQLESTRKKQSHVLNHWRRNLRLCEKYGAPYTITTGTSEKYGMRAPRDLASVIDSLGYSGKKAVSDFPRDVLERAGKVRSGEFVRPGVEVEEDE